MSKKIGAYTVTLLDTGEFALDGGAMFGVVPKVLWEKTNPADSSNRIDMALRIMLIQGHGKNILVDAGAGEDWDEKLKKIYRIDYSRFSLKKALDTQRLKFSDITDVIISHLHFDHVCGAMHHSEEGFKPTFPNATYYVQKKQWEWAMEPSEKDRASYFKEKLNALKTGKLKLLEGEQELFPGIFVLVMNGHTPSQQVVKVTDGKNTLLFCADLIPTFSHVPIPYNMGYDHFPLSTIEEKRTILEQVAKENWILCFEHDPKVPAVTVFKDSKTGRFLLKEKIIF